MYYIGIADIPLDEAISILKAEMSAIFVKYPEIFLVVPAIGLVFSLYYLIRSIYGYQKLALENKIYIVFCAIIVFVMAGSLLTVHYEWLEHNKFLTTAIYLAFTSLPSFFCLHIWSQVSHNKVMIRTIILYFIVPFAVTVWFAKEQFTGESTESIWQFFSTLRPIGYVTAFYAIYWICITLKSFRLCLNVFYQMPRHMQSSTLLLLSALAVTVVITALAVYVGTESCHLLWLLLLVFNMNRAYNGFFRASASNVIATSRQFVFSNLGTQMFILSGKGRILEWNKPQNDVLLKAVHPKYLQPYSDFREKLIEAGSGIVSPHDPNVLTLTINDKEHDILIHRHPITEGEKQFGELIEISEVTDLYTVLHQMEQISFIDQMTGLRNRNAYITKAQNIMKAENMPLLMVVGDVNNLKAINDKLGHIVGDRMLKDLADIIKEYAPDRAFLARIGGDEFIMLLPNAEETFGDEFIRRIESKCASLFDEEYGYPNISLGWAIARSAFEDYNSVFEKADAFMYGRKKAYKEQTNPGRQLSGMLPSDIHPIGDTPLASQTVKDEVTVAPETASDKFVSP